MIKAILKSTNNPKYAYLIGVVGDLSEVDGKFKFRFRSQRGVQIMSSKITRRMGSLSDYRSYEVAYDTPRSVYVFEKIDNVERVRYVWD